MSATTKRRETKTDAPEAPKAPAQPLPHETRREAETTARHTVNLGATPAWIALAEAHAKVTREAAAQRAEHARQRAEEERAREYADRPPVGSPQLPHESPEQFLRRREWENAEAEAED